MAIWVIFDTDIGTDVDDCLALGVLLGSPEIRIEGITCVYGDVALRSRMVRKLLALRGKSDIPVFEGVRDPILRRDPVYWGGHEGIGLLDDDDDLPPVQPEHAVDYLVRIINEHPGEIHLLAVGPLTNVAAAIVRDPGVARQLKHLTIMGGALRRYEDTHLALAEHNIKCDPEAAHIVAISGAPMTWAPLDVTTKVSITRAGVDRIRAANTPFHDAVARQVEQYPRFAEQSSTFLHDPLAAACIVRPDLVEFADLHIDIELESRLSRGATLMRNPTGSLLSTGKVALKVDQTAAETFIVERIAAAG
jgi:purine nucleosidase